MLVVLYGFTLSPCVQQNPRHQETAYGRMHIPILTCTFSLPWVLTQRTVLITIGLLLQKDVDVHVYVYFELGVQESSREVLLQYRA